MSLLPRNIQIAITVLTIIDSLCIQLRNPYTSQYRHAYKRTPVYYAKRISCGFLPALLLVAFPENINEKEHVSCKFT